MVTKDYETAAGMLSLVMATPPTSEQLRGLTTREFVESKNWAEMAHLSANDNSVQVPERPAALDRFDRNHPMSWCDPEADEDPASW